MIFQELSSIPNELIPVFQKEPSSGWPEYYTQSTSKPQSGVKKLDRLLQPTTNVTPSTTFLSTIKISAVQTQATSANSSTTVAISKRRTKTADIIAKKQPRKQFIRETVSPATLLEVNIPKTNSTVPKVSANTTNTQSSRPNFLNLHQYTTTPPPCETAYKNNIKLKYKPKPPVLVDTRTTIGIQSTSCNPTSIDSISLVTCHTRNLIS